MSGRRYVNPSVVRTQDLREGDVLFAAPGYSNRAWRAERTEEWIAKGYKRVSCYASPEDQARIRAHVTSVCNREDIIRTAMEIGLNMLDKWYPVRPVGKVAKGGAS